MSKRISHDYWLTGPRGLVHFWYDFDIRCWIVTRRERARQNDSYGDQIGAAEFAGTRAGAEFLARQMTGLTTEHSVP